MINRQQAKSIRTLLLNRTKSDIERFCAIEGFEPSIRSTLFLTGYDLELSSRPGRRDLALRKFV